MNQFPDIPGYTFKHRLGRGGMATVYLAVHNAMNRSVAMKVMDNKLSDDSVWAKRFIQEAQVIAQLSHPSIVPVYDVGVHGGRYYITMEYLEGGSLKDKLKEGVSLGEALKIVLGIAAGLDFAGEKGFVHRDIKPDNIMFRDDGAPVILDFGIVKQMTSSQDKMTQTGVIIGTTSYMSPEQAQGKELDQRSDLYSLGIIFYEMLVGKLPYIGDSDVDTLIKHIKDPIPTLPPDLAIFQPLINKILAKDAMRRFTRGSALIEHLETLEPQIKSLMVAAMSRPQAVADDINDATIVVAPHDSKIIKKVTSEEELTKVLSSAKATIRDFSVESRARKARRSRYYFALLSATAVITLGYLGFQQFYLAPKQKAAVEEQLRQAAQQVERKIENILHEADALRQRLDYSDRQQVDHIVALYRKAEALDHSNIQARTALIAFGNHFIGMAFQAVGEKNVKEAIIYRDYAQLLNPENSSLESLRQGISHLRSQQLESALVEKNILNLLKLAEKDIAATEGFSDSAHTKLQQVLELSPGNRKAQALIESMLKKLYQLTEKNIVHGRLARAQTDLDVLKRHSPDKQKNAELASKIRQRKHELQRTSSLTSLLKKADALQRERRTAESNDALRDLYLSVLQLDHGNAQAKKGLLNTCDFDSQLFRQAIAERDYGRAQRSLDIIEKFTPSYGKLVQLKQELTASKRAVATANELLADARSLMTAPDAGESKRINLATARQKVDAAAEQDSTNPDLPVVMLELESAYVLVISQLLSENNHVIADTYFKDTAGKTWPSDRLLSLQLAKTGDKKKDKKRVISGGF